MSTALNNIFRKGASKKAVADPMAEEIERLKAEMAMAQVRGRGGRALWQRLRRRPDHRRHLGRHAMHTRDVHRTWSR